MRANVPEWEPGRRGTPPALPRLLKPEAIKKTIADGVNQKLFAYAGKAESGAYEPFIFEPTTGIDESDIELSDEMVLLKAEDARLLVEPARLSGIEVKPANATMKPGDSTTLSVCGYDQQGRSIATPPVAWSATGGTIEQDGRFTADQTGDYRVDARVDSLIGTANVRVQTGPEPDPGHSKGTRLICDPQTDE
jgi:hypothetical protein